MLQFASGSEKSGAVGLSVIFVTQLTARRFSLYFCFICFFVSCFYLLCTKSRSSTQSSGFKQTLTEAVWPVHQNTVVSLLSGNTSLSLTWTGATVTSIHGDDVMIVCRWTVIYGNNANDERTTTLKLRSKKVTRIDTTAPS